MTMARLTEENVDMKNFAEDDDELLDDEKEELGDEDEEEDGDEDEEDNY